MAFTIIIYSIYTNNLYNNIAYCSIFTIFQRFFVNNYTLIDYMVILEDRKSYYKLITAYVVHNYSKNGYAKDYNTFIKTKTPII